MRNLTIPAATVAVLAIAPAALAAPVHYSIDSAHSSANFKVKHLMVSNVRGSFSDLKGSITYDAAHPEQTVVEATIGVASVNTGNEKRDGHLKSPDFFDVANHPKMTFTSTAVKKQGQKLLVTGDLSLHGVTKPVTLTVEGPTKEWTNPWGQVVRGASVTGKINRKDFGLAWGKVTEAGAVVVGEDVNLEFELELVKAAEAPKDAKPADAKK